MPERTLFYSPLAKHDLDEIFDYIAYELENPSSANETVNAILNAAESLEGFPFIGSPVKGLPFATDEYRFLGALNYLILPRDGISHLRRSHSIQPPRLPAVARSTIAGRPAFQSGSCRGVPTACR